MIKVTIDMGRHTMKTPYGMKKLFEETIVSLGIEKGNFEVHLGENKKGSEFQQGIKLIELLPEVCSIRVKAQTAEKSGMHICVIKFPGMYKGAELARFADLLQNKFGKAELAENNIDDAVTTEEVESLQQGCTAKVLGSVPLEELNYQEKPADEMLILVLDEIFAARGTNWTSKRDFFTIIKASGVNYPENKLIGVFLHRGYLEVNPDKPKSSSRLTPLACRLIGKTVPVADKTDSVNVISEEDAKILRRIRELQGIKSAHDEIMQNMKSITDELNLLREQDLLLASELSRITALLAENEKKIQEKQNEIFQIEQRITPEMIHATQAIEIMSLFDTSL